MRGQYAVVMLLLAGIFLSGCTTPEDNPAKAPLKVIVTIPPQQEFVQEVGGDRVEVIVIVPPGAEPHTYEPTPQQLVAVADADIYFRVGTGLLPIEDAVAARLKEMNRDLLVIDTSSGIAYLGGAEEYAAGPPDPHIWLSLSNAQIMVNHTCGGLSAVDPGHADHYKAGRDAYLLRLDEADGIIRSTLAAHPTTTIMVTHPAWGYFARDYGLEQVAIETDGKEPSAKDLEALIALARREKITVVFSEAQESERNAGVIAREIGGRVQSVDPIAGDYLANMLEVAGMFAASQEQ